MITDDMREEWFALKASGRVLEYLGLEPEEEAYVVIDFSRTPDKNGRYWSHLACSNIEALHTLVKNLGGQRKWFQNKPGRPHYDLYGAPKEKALAILEDHLMPHKAIVEFLQAFHVEYKGDPNFKKKRKQLQ